jgi:hypothetical protein
VHRINKSLWAQHKTTKHKDSVFLPFFPSLKCALEYIAKYQSRIQNETVRKEGIGMVESVKSTNLQI